MRKKICMITSGHSPFDDRILYKEARTLHNNGYETVIVVPANERGNFVDMANGEIVPTDPEKMIYDADGILIKGFRKYKKRNIRRYYEIVKNLIRLAVNEDADIYHCHEGDISLLVALIVKRVLKKKGRSVKLIYDVHEYWPGVYGRIVKNIFGQWIIKKIFCLWEKKAIAHCDYVITANQIVRGHILLLDRFAKVTVLLNCPDLKMFPEYKRPIDEYLLCHEGTLHFKRGLKEMVEIIRKLKNEFPSIKLKIVGDVFNEERKWLAEKVKEYDLKDNIIVTGWQPYYKVGENIAGASIGLIMFHPTPNNMLAGPPNKVFNYMRYGLAIVTTDLPETRLLINEVDCGFVVGFNDPVKIYRAITMLLRDRQLREKFAANGKQAVADKYNWSHYGKLLIRIYNEVLHDDFE